jgi:hypothetical protein
MAANNEVVSAIYRPASGTKMNWNEREEDYNDSSGISTVFFERSAVYENFFWLPKEYTQFTVADIWFAKHSDFLIDLSVALYTENIWTIPAAFRK